MKAYQERWLERLYRAKRSREVIAVCKRICEDDTGHTGALTMQLAEAYLRLAKQTGKKP